MIICSLTEEVADVRIVRANPDMRRSQQGTSMRFSKISNLGVESSLNLQSMVV